MPEAEQPQLRRRGLWLEIISMAWTVAVASVAIAAGVAASSIALIGLGLESAVALLSMPLLALGKRRTGRALSSRLLLADAEETTLAAAAAAAALAGVGLDTWLGWWWTVPAAGLVIAALAFREGIHIWRHGPLSVG